MVSEVKHLPMIACASIDRGSSVLVYSVSDLRQSKSSTRLVKEPAKMDGYFGAAAAL
jgi:hypothetical protein